LPRGSVLRETQGWAERNYASADEATFISASAAAETAAAMREQERTAQLLEAEAHSRAAESNALSAAALAQRQRWLALIAVVIALVVGIGALFGVLGARREASAAEVTIQAANAQGTAIQQQVATSQIEGTRVAFDVMNARALFAADQSRQQLAAG